ncbi:MAG: tRNA-(ms[2]io[6]A)-hydroxylase [Gammaproteobacteria bacterium]
MSLSAFGELLTCATPSAWVASAAAHLELLLLDHANCEKKAAATAFRLMFRYGDRHPGLQAPLSRLAREELRHFEQVLRLLAQRGIAMRPLTASRYAAGLQRTARAHDPARLTDLLLIGALIEARSCERFTALAPALDRELAEFYRALAAAEARHCSLYLKLAQQHAPENLAPRIAYFAATESALIEGTDTEFRFHSGVPQPQS